ncbi:hypothetical protein MKA27_19845 [[Clostridium] innocuum]|uniref:hypothetical protein n=1 Tax=Clostridium innocuum TaxID=1522 RepID=UPI000D6AF64A|nr:hypothetical protein [[Clostridium] innocuum]MCR0316653.1 hypothetical protein [[Clostridium] innocuum]MCR0371724.1 hypothetical protein [[Clostridium] innocuum]MCR0376044.1 hypothetical protein [[Clostridium] innocuum]MCR0561314.1 hypothetical protein [[Clostridium] innocuum]MCR0604362.1 hypothetical protein [[Clostridium] innocuum]
MSTNYYFKWNDNKVNDIHIGKRSCGWVPLFQATPYFRSVNDIKNFYIQNKAQVKIIDEYDTEYTWEELEKELINWPGERNHYPYKDFFYQDEAGYDFTEREFS